MTKMTVEKFVDEYNCLEALAIVMFKKIDDEKVSVAAKQFLTAQENFLKILDEIGYELG